MAVNLLGALLAGAAVAGVGRSAPLVVAGFLGGLTTVSALAVEADVLFRDGHGAVAAAIPNLRTERRVLRRDFSASSSVGG